MTTTATSNALLLSFLLVVAVAMPGPALAQGSATEDISTAPLECYTRTSTDAVRVGEPFTYVLTCAVLETASTTVVPDQSVLDPAALQVTPFEVLGGTRPDDIRTSSRRLFQYEYRLRYIGEDFGREVTLTGPTITYRVQNRDAQGGTIEGRERTYMLPSTPIRILSLLPAGAADLREPAPATFGEIQQQRVRANALRIGSLALLALSAGIAVWALVGALRRPERPRVAVPRLPSEAAALRAARRELAAVARDRRVSGWTPELTARALSAVRAAATLAAHGRLAMTPMQNGATPVEGQFVVRGRLGRSPVLVSGAAAGAARALDGRHGALKEALELFTHAAYGRTRLDDSVLDEAMQAAERGIAQASAHFRWPLPLLRRLARRGAPQDQQAWAR